MPRGDAPVVRHLAERCDADVALEWQEAPYLVLPAVSIVELAAEGIAWSGDLERLPWHDVVIDAGDLMALVHHERIVHVDREAGMAKALELGASREEAEIHLDAAEAAVTRANRPRHSWLRVRTVEEVRSRLRRSSPWLRAEQHREWLTSTDEDRWLVVEYWDEVLVDGGALEPYVVVLDRWARLDDARLESGALSKEDELVWRVGRLAVGVLSVFVDPPLYLVRTRTERPTREKRLDPKRFEKRKRAKPWTREDLESIILVDPSRLEDVGHPSTTRTVGEDRAPPRLHTRRGHWRTLPKREEGEEPRRTWVRPAWVGAESWQAEGRVYQLAQMPAAVAVARATTGGGRAHPQ